MTQHFDVVVLGAGPGGYVAAIRASQLGLKAAVIEKKYWGGVCLNVGCIPSKALLRNAEIAHIITAEKKVFGIEGDATMAFGPTHARSRAVADASAKGVHYLMKKNKITEIVGAHMIGPEVTELLPALTLAQQWDLTADEVARNVFAHPTLSEAMKEAVEGIAGHMINL